MSYVKRSLGHNEEIIFVARFHWIYTVGAFLALIFLGVFLVGIWLFIAMMVRKFTTEMAITNERFVYKTGLISRTTSEVNLNNIEEVSLHQSIFGRILGYGQLTVRGTGTGLIELPSFIAHPLQLRRAIIRIRDETGGYQQNARRAVAKPA